VNLKDSEQSASNSAAKAAKAAQWMKEVVVGMAKEDFETGGWEPEENVVQADSAVED
jgi:hypothetical protein